MIRVLLAGGGSGGHVYPALATAAALRGLISEPVIAYAGTPAGVEARLAGRAHLPFYPVAAGAIRGRSPLGLARGGVRLAAGLRDAIGVLRQFQPDVVMATGGYACVPVVVAARLLGVPTLVYLPDVEPGLAVRFLARIATRLAVTVDESRQYLPSGPDQPDRNRPPGKVVTTGYPVRPEFLAIDRTPARQSLGLPPDDPVLLIFGGSQGARTLNLAVERDLPGLVELAHVIHSAGAEDLPRLRERATALPPERADRYRLAAYLDEEMGPSLAAADLVVSRAGASTLGELPAFGLAGVLVPYPYAGAHQWQNASYLQRRGAAVALANDAVRDGALLPLVRELLNDRPRLAAMRGASRALANPAGAANLARELVALGRSGR